MATLTEQRHKMFADMQPDSEKLLTTHDRAFPSWARREMRARRLVCFLVETDPGKVVGGGSIWLREVQPHPGFAGGPVPYLMSTFTEPKHRGKGIATMLVRKAISWSRSRGYPSISLHASRKGEPLYRKFGWEASREMSLELRRTTRPGRSPKVRRRPRRSGR